MALIHTELLSGNQILFWVEEKVFLSFKQGVSEKFVYENCGKLQMN